MLRLAVNTKKSPEEVMREAHQQFGKHGLGLEVNEAGGRVTFSGAGGYVTIAFENDGGKTVVDISSREFDEPVRKFARKLR
ncbi:MAG: hypothetical protein O3B31_06595 [Chloroflexi bacterium]|nr:hypothetical protein [Chloroflexota bacterium]